MPDLQTSRQQQLEAARDHAREMLSRFVPRAVEVLTELMELAENDRVRLSAANSLLDRAGVVTPQEITIREDPMEHQLVKEDAEAIMRRIAANAEQRAQRGPKSLEAIMVHEGTEDEDSA